MQENKYISYLEYSFTFKQITINTLYYTIILKNNYKINIKSRIEERIK